MVVCEGIDPRSHRSYVDDEIATTVAVTAIAITTRTLTLSLASLFILIKTLLRMYGRYFIEALLLSYLKRYGDVYENVVLAMLDKFSYSFDQTALCLAMLGVVGVVARLAALVGLLVLHREKQH